MKRGGHTFVFLSVWQKKVNCRMFVQSYLEDQNKHGQRVGWHYVLVILIYCRVAIALQSQNKDTFFQQNRSAIAITRSSRFTFYPSTLSFIIILGVGKQS